MTQHERMLAGLPYDASDADLVLRRSRSRDLASRYNATRMDEAALRQSLLAQWLGRCGSGVAIEPPFYCDYGVNVELADQVFLNFGCILLDCARISLGRNVLVGPGVQFLAATHPIDPAQRQQGLESAAPITVEENVWIGGGAILCPGVVIGQDSTIGAGSVVTRNVPRGVVAAGNPCRVLRSLA